MNNVNVNVSLKWTKSVIASVLKHLGCESEEIVKINNLEDLMNWRYMYLDENGKKVDVDPFRMEGKNVFMNKYVKFIVENSEHMDCSEPLYWLLSYGFVHGMYGNDKKMGELLLKTILQYRNSEVAAMVVELDTYIDHRELKKIIEENADASAAFLAYENEWHTSIEDECETRMFPIEWVRKIVKESEDKDFLYNFKREYPWSDMFKDMLRK